jgi:mono/diheme cytochrome c family protein
MMHDRKRRARRRADAVSSAVSGALGPILLGALAMLLTGSGVRAADHIELPPGPNRELVYGACRTCHDLQYLVESAGITRDDWSDLIDSMRQYGLRIPPERRAKILGYLGTYLGPNPPPKGAAAAKPEQAKPADGATLFAEQCIACHQKSGKGLAGSFPPLAGNLDLMRDRVFPVYVLLNGLEGKITVAGKDYNAQMPPFSHLSDAEIAALVRYIRGAWNNASLRPANMKPVDAETVKAARTKTMTAAAVHAYRARLP